MAMTQSFESGTLTLTTGEGLTLTGAIEDGEFVFRSPLAGSDPVQNHRCLKIQDGGGHIELNKVGSLPATGLSVEVADGLLVVHDA